MTAGTPALDAPLRTPEQAALDKAREALVGLIAAIERCGVTWMPLSPIDQRLAAARAVIRDIDTLRRG